MQNIVVVESPAKAKTINKYLGKDYDVIASFGHVRDLPSKDGSVNPDDNFDMKWEVSQGSEKHIKEIIKRVKQAETLYLATDPDREGEAISWHIQKVLEEKKALKTVGVHRVTFNEITKKAVKEAIENPRHINDELVEAYLARRALDYLVGFTLSPILWRRLPGSKSAGRVQSVALRLITEREDEIEKFISQEYWSITGNFKNSEDKKYSARLTHYNDQKLEKFDIANETQVTDIVNLLQKFSYKIDQVKPKKTKRNPYPPFTTSTLQQEASRKLRFSATRTMRLAQQLYEGISIGNETVGLITYMRTDSIHLSQEAINSSRQLIGKEFGPNYLPKSPRKYQNKTKNAQEAHEAIRPTDPSKLPQNIKSYLDPDQFKLYELIWKRTIASQMESALFDQLTVDIVSDDKKHTFRATGSVLAFDGFLKLYQESNDDSDDNKDEFDKRLPKIQEGENANLITIEPKQHFTEPPPRYSEASLVKKLEELGIGRPSTYASIIQVLQNRDYVVLEKRRFFPQERGRLVISFLKNFFLKYVQYDFTASLEDELDNISNGQANWLDILRKFWDKFKLTVDETKNLKPEEVLEAIEKDMAAHLFTSDDPSVDMRKCTECADGRLGLKIGRFGSFIGCSNYPECRYTKQITENKLDQDETSEAPKDKELGIDPETKLPILLKKGPYGFYIQLGEKQDNNEKPKRTSIPKDINMDNLDLSMAVKLLSLPRELGKHPETGEMISAGLGRYGPYLKHGSKFKSLQTTEDALTIGMNRAVDVLSQTAVKSDAKELGKHPEDDKPVTVQSGRYGPYVKHGKVNAPLPKTSTVETVTLEEAIELLEKRKAKKKS